MIQIKSYIENKSTSQFKSMIAQFIFSIEYSSKSDTTIREKE